MRKIKIISVCLFLVSIVISSCSDKKKETAAVQSTAGAKYTCPMHSQIMEDHPGNCPICGMTLVKKSGQASEGSGISLNTVLQPVNSSVIASIPAITPEQKRASVTIEAQGYLDFDARTFNNISSRFSGRIEKLYIKYAFQEIHKGERIFDIYSPDMVTSQQDLLFTIRNSSQEPELIKAAKQKLLLLGMTDAQINKVIKTGKAFYSLPVYSPYNGHVHNMPHSQMDGFADSKESTDYSDNLPLNIKEGMYVTEGQTLFNVVDPHQLWAVIKIDAPDIAAIKLNQTVKITIPDLPGKTISGKVNFIEPTLRDGDKTISIRVYLDNMNHELKVNSLVKAEIETGQITGLWIPRAAMYDLGRAQIVWVKNGSAFQAHQVSIGAINGNDVLITKGLVATDSLASNAQYLIDSESFVKTKK